MSVCLIFRFRHISDTKFNVGWCFVLQKKNIKNGVSVDSSKGNGQDERIIRNTLIWFHFFL